MAPGSIALEGAAAAANPWDMRQVRGPASRMRLHLRFHREGLCDMLADGAARYVAEIYPVGERLATDCSRLAFAVFTYLVAQCPTKVLEAASPTQLPGAACPDAALVQQTPLVHYLSLTQDGRDPFDTSCGHRLVLLQTKSRVRLLHAYQGQFTLQEFMRNRCAASMTTVEFQAWWQELQAALALPEVAAREHAFSKLLGAEGFREPVAGSWMLTQAADLSGGGYHGA